MPIEIETINFGGWPNCRRLSDGVVEVVVTTDVGPRLVRFGFVGGPNEFREYPDLQGLTGGDTWRMYGGHRLWHAPEDLARTCQPDNAPVLVEPLQDGLRFVQPVEAATGLQKEIDLRLRPGSAHVRVAHRLRNCGLWTVPLAPWALSVMAMGGTAIIPLPPRGTHPENLLPASHLVLWAYTDMSDPRWTWGQKYLLLRQDPGAQTPQKLGASVPDGWTAYARDGHLFVKRFAYVPGAPYPDTGCAVETFTDATMIELETLGPLVDLAPRATVEHVEDWYLFDNVPMPRNDADVEAQVLPRVAETRQ